MGVAIAKRVVRGVDDVDDLGVVEDVDDLGVVEDVDDLGDVGDVGDVLGFCLM